MYSSKFKCKSESSTNTKGIHNTDLISVSSSESAELLERFNIKFCLRTYSSKNINPKIISDMNKSKVVFCRIADYSQKDDTIVVPDWMMESLEVEDDDIVTLSEVRIDKIKTVKIEPHNKEMFEVFTENMNVSEILSPLISNYGCLTRGATITIDLFGDTWKINISDMVSPNGKNRKGGIIMHTDIEVDILPALNDKPPSVEEINEKVMKALAELKEESKPIIEEPKIKVDDGLTDIERARDVRVKRFSGIAVEEPIVEIVDVVEAEVVDMTKAEMARAARMKRFK